MAIRFDGNDYGITRKEFREFKREMRKLDRESDAIELTKKDYKEIKTHVKNGDLGTYMDNVGAEIRAAMGLSLKGKVDAAKEINESVEIAQTTNLGDNVDVKKVLEFIKAADYPRIAANQEKFNEIHRELEANNSRAMAERFFASSINSSIYEESQGLV